MAKGDVAITVVGNLIQDLEPRVTQSGKTMVTGRLAHNERYYDRNTNSWQDGDSSFYSLTIFNKDGENALNSLKKGDRVIVTGTLKIRTFTRKDGSNGNDAQITVDEIGPSLKFKSVQVDRNRQGGGQQGGNNSGGFNNQGNGGFNNQGNGGFSNQGSQNNANQANAGGDPWGSDPAAAEDPFSNSGADAAFGGW